MCLEGFPKESTGFSRVSRVSQKSLQGFPKVSTGFPQRVYRVSLKSFQGFLESPGFP